MYSVQEDELPEIRFLLIIIGWGELSKAILNETAIHDVNSFRFVDSRVFCQVTWAVFFRALSKYNSSKDDPPFPP